jgi:hypothetical protein
MALCVFERGGYPSYKGIDQFFSGEFFNAAYGNAAGRFAWFYMAPFPFTEKKRSALKKRGFTSLWMYQNY